LSLPKSQPFLTERCRTEPGEEKKGGPEASPGRKQKSAPERGGKKEKAAPLMMRVKRRGPSLTSIATADGKREKKSRFLTSWKKKNENLLQVKCRWLFFLGVTGGGGGKKPPGPLLKHSARGEKKKKNLLVATLNQRLYWGKKEVPAG